MTALSARLGLDVTNLKAGARQAATSMRDVKDEIDDATASAEELNRQKIEPEVDVAAQSAIATLARLDAELAGLSNEEIQVELRAEVNAARRNLRAVNAELLAVEGADARAEVTVRAEAAQADLRAVKSRLADIDGEIATAKVEVADDGFLDRFGELPDSMSGALDDVATKLNSPGGVLAGLAAMTLAAKGVADNFANTALEAQTYADLTGTSVDHASRLLAVTNRVGIEANDLSDITLQMTQAFADAPELADQLGINLNDGKAPAERLVQVLDLMNAGILTAEESAQVFGQLLGEEGVRQGQALATQIGDIGKAIEDVPDTQVITDDDVRMAREYQKSWAELTAVAKGLGVELARVITPEMLKLADRLGMVADGLDAINTGLDRLGGFAGIELPDFLSLASDAAYLTTPLGMVDKAASDITDGFEAVFGADLHGTLELATDESGRLAEAARWTALAEQELADAADNAARTIDRQSSAADNAVDPNDDYATSMQSVEKSADNATESLADYVDQQRAMLDPAFAAIKAQQRLDAALADLAAEGGNTEQNLMAVVEAQIDLDAANADLALSGGDAVAAIENAGRAAGLTETQIAELTSAVGGATAAANDFAGDYQATLDADTGPADAAIGNSTTLADLWDQRIATGTLELIDNASGGLYSVQQLADSLNGKVTTVTVRTVNQTVNGGSTKKSDGGGSLVAGELSQVAEARPEIVNGMLVLEPTTIVGPADITGGQLTSALLGRGSDSAASYARTGSGGSTGVATGAPSIVQVSVDGQPIRNVVHRTVASETERKALYS